MVRGILFTAFIASVSAQELEPFGFYDPALDVSEHLKIDLDVAEISALAKNASFAAAADVYLNGKHSSKGGDTLRNLAGFSIDLRGKKEEFDASLELLKEFDLFAEYYGADDYAHKFVMGALNGTGDASGLDDIARWQLATKGAQYQSVWMYVLYELAKSINLCFKGEDGRKNWDEGAAFYVGSLIKSDGSNGADGQLLYTLAEKRCQSFGTCNGKTGTEPSANANKEAMSAFNEGLKAISNKDCSAASKQYNLIRKHMQIPLIQGMLLYAFKSDKVNNGNSKDMSEAWAFTAGVLPFFHQVDSDAAAFLRTNMELKTGVSQTIQSGYEEVFKAVYGVLPALCISCEELGVNSFALGTAPTCTTDAKAYEAGCEANLVPVSKEIDLGLIVGASVTGFVLVSIILGIMWYMNRSEKKSKAAESSKVVAQQV